MRRKEGVMVDGHKKELCGPCIERGGGCPWVNKGCEGADSKGRSL